MEADVLHQLAIPSQPAKEAVFSLHEQLCLVAGGEGVIGRRVSLMDGGQLIGEGIMGWN